MKIFIASVFLIASTLAEPPVNRYLPPQGQNRGSSLSKTYGTPSFGSQAQTGAAFRQPSSTYGAPSRSRPNSQYLPPSNQYGLPRSNSQSPSSLYQAPTSQYQAPISQYQAPTSQYQVPTSQYQAPTSQYQAPTSQYQAPTSQYQTPSNQYGLPNQGQSFGQTGNGIQYNTPSQEYGTPGTGRGNYNQQSRQYLPPGGGYDDGSNGEPANYNFEYMVKDAYSGNDFGHRESRQGDRAEGLYYVLLPDGRKQTVQYEADQDGYKPRISYEDTGARAGYNGNSQSGYDDQYSSGPY